MSTKDVITKDSGSRRSFVTGSVRDAATGKGRYDLVTPIGLLRIAQLYERGAEKYEARNWEKGQPQTVFMDCAMRHLQRHLAGHRDEDHLAAAAWNVMAIMHQEHEIGRGALPAELDDFPDYVTPVKDTETEDLYANMTGLPQKEEFGPVFARTLILGDVFKLATGDGTAFIVLSNQVIKDTIISRVAQAPEGATLMDYYFKGAERVYLLDARPTLEDVVLDKYPDPRPPCTEERQADSDLQQAADSIAGMMHGQEERLPLITPEKAAPNAQTYEYPYGQSERATKVVEKVEVAARDLNVGDKFTIGEDCSAHYIVLKHKTEEDVVLAYVERGRQDVQYHFDGSRRVHLSLNEEQP